MAPRLILQPAPAFASIAATGAALKRAQAVATPDGVAGAEQNRALALLDQAAARTG
jgi:hypothetical protein